MKNNVERYTKEGLPKITNETLAVLGRDICQMVKDGSLKVNFSNWREEIKKENPLFYGFMTITANQPNVDTLDKMTALYQLLKSQAETYQLNDKL